MAGKPVTNAREPHFTCPVTGFPTPISKAVPNRGRWVHPLAVDERAYRDQQYDIPVPPHKLHYTRRKRPKPDIDGRY